MKYIFQEKHFIKIYAYHQFLNLPHIYKIRLLCEVIIFIITIYPIYNIGTGGSFTYTISSLILNVEDQNTVLLYINLALIIKNLSLIILFIYTFIYYSTNKYQTELTSIESKSTKGMLNFLTFNHWSYYIFLLLTVNSSLFVIEMETLVSCILRSISLGASLLYLNRIIMILLNIIVIVISIITNHSLVYIQFSIFPFERSLQSNFLNKNGYFRHLTMYLFIGFNIINTVFLSNIPFTSISLVVYSKDYLKSVTIIVFLLCSLSLLYKLMSKKEFFSKDYFLLRMIMTYSYFLMSFFSLIYIHLLKEDDLKANPFSYKLFYIVISFILSLGFTYVSYIKYYIIDDYQRLKKDDLLELFFIHLWNISNSSSLLVVLNIYHDHKLYCDNLTCICKNPLGNSEKSNKNIDEMKELSNLKTVSSMNFVELTKIYSVFIDIIGYVKLINKTKFLKSKSTSKERIRLLFIQIYLEIISESQYFIILKLINELKTIRNLSYKERISVFIFERKIKYILSNYKRKTNQINTEISVKFKTFIEVLRLEDMIERNIRVFLDITKSLNNNYMIDIVSMINTMKTFKKERQEIEEDYLKIVYYKDKILIRSFSFLLKFYFYSLVLIRNKDDLYYKVKKYIIYLMESMRIKYQYPNNKILLEIVKEKVYIRKLPIYLSNKLKYSHIELKNTDLSNLVPYYLVNAFEFENIINSSIDFYNHIIISNLLFDKEDFLINLTLKGCFLDFNSSLFFFGDAYCNNYDTIDDVYVLITERGELLSISKEFECIFCVFNEDILKNPLKFNLYSIILGLKEYIDDKLSKDQLITSGYEFNIDTKQHKDYLYKNRNYLVNKVFYSNYIQNFTKSIEGTVEFIRTYTINNNKLLSDNKINSTNKAYFLRLKVSKTIDETKKKQEKQEEQNEMTEYITHKELLDNELFKNNPNNNDYKIKKRLLFYISFLIFLVYFIFKLLYSLSYLQSIYASNSFLIKLNSLHTKHIYIYNTVTYLNLLKVFLENNKNKENKENDKEIQSLQVIHSEVFNNSQYINSYITTMNELINYTDIYNSLTYTFKNQNTNNFSIKLSYPKYLTAVFNSNFSIFNSTFHIKSDKLSFINENYSLLKEIFLYKQEVLSEILFENGENTKFDMNHNEILQSIYDILNYIQSIEDLNTIFNRIKLISYTQTQENTYGIYVLIILESLIVLFLLTFILFQILLFFEIKRINTLLFSLIVDSQLSYNEKIIHIEHSIESIEKINKFNSESDFECLSKEVNINHTNNINFIINTNNISNNMILNHSSSMISTSNNKLDSSNKGKIQRKSNVYKKLHKKSISKSIVLDSNHNNNNLFDEEEEKVISNNSLQYHNSYSVKHKENQLETKNHIENNIGLTTNENLINKTDLEKKTFHNEISIPSKVKGIIFIIYALLSFTIIFNIITIVKYSLKEQYNLYYISIFNGLLLLPSLHGEYVYVKSILPKIELQKNVFFSETLFSNDSIENYSLINYLNDLSLSMTTSQTQGKSYELLKNQSNQSNQSSLYLELYDKYSNHYLDNIKNEYDMDFILKTYNNTLCFIYESKEDINNHDTDHIQSIIDYFRLCHNDSSSNFTSKTYKAYDYHKDFKEIIITYGSYIDNFLRKNLKLTGSSKERFESLSIYELNLLLLNSLYPFIYSKVNESLYIKELDLRMTRFIIENSVILSVQILILVLLFFVFIWKFRFVEECLVYEYYFNVLEY